MPIRGLSIDSKLAGIQLTAMHQTLSHFLELASQDSHNDHAPPPQIANSGAAPSTKGTSTEASASSDVTAGVPEILAVAESDPAILASLISFFGRSVTPGPDWIESFSVRGLRTVGMALATERIAQYVAPRELETIALNRKEAHLHGMLAQELAVTLGTIDPVQAKITAVLTGLSCLLGKVSEADIQEAGVAGLVPTNDTLAANLLTEWGFPASLSDVVRYQNRDLSSLTDASEIIQVVAVARSLIPYVSGPELVNAQLLDALNRLVPIDEEALYGVIGRAGLNYDRQERLLEKNRLKDSSQLESANPDTAMTPPLRLLRLVSDNALGVVFNEFLLASEPAGSQSEFSLPSASGTSGLNDGLLDDGVLEVARFLFGFTSLCHFAPLTDPESVKETTRLVGQVNRSADLHRELQPERIEINLQSETSFIAAAFRNEDIVSVPQADIVAISELQLSRRFGGSGLICIPLGRDAGVLVSSAESVAQFDLLGHNNLLDRFVETLVERYRKKLVAKKESSRLEVDYVKRRVSEVTHEVNNPLAVVQNYLRTLSLKLDENAPVQSDIKTISEEIQRVSKIVRKYAEIGRKEDLLTEEVNINQVLVKLLEVFKGGHEKLEIRTNLDASIPLVSMSSDSFKQVIVNLIKNSIEALAGQNHQLITIDTHADVNFGGISYVEIVLTDNGPGIPHDIRERLFQPNNSGKSEGHSGLGLSIVKALMEDMRGMVSCRSQTGLEGTPGTVFQLLIPK